MNLAVPQLPDALLHAAAWPHPVQELRVIETHISWVILTGKLAYKIKKPLDLGFLDFSTLERRRQACEEELRLNRRLAPGLYLAVVPIIASGNRLYAGKDGEPVEYAVQMRQFPDGALLAHELAAGGLVAADLRRLAGTVADFHARLPQAAAGSASGSPEQVWAPIAQSLAQLAELGAGQRLEGGLTGLSAGLRQRFDTLQPLLEQRRTGGMIRECHGDLHLGNLVRLDGHITAFDALEFDPALRWTDVMAEVAFLVMDLCVHGRRDLAVEFLNEYLAQTGDYDGAALLPLYLAYRALVRAKVTLLAPAGDGQARVQANQAADRLLEFAAHPSLLARSPALLLLCGPSGSGKSWLARGLAPRLPAIHLRSDVERKRLAGLPAMAHSDSTPGAGLYTPAMSAATYRRLASLATGLLRAGFHVLVDAAGLARAQRRIILGSHGRPAGGRVLLWLVGPPSLLASRIGERQARGDDPSEANLAVLEEQLRRLEPPDAGEAERLLTLDVAGSIDPATLAAGLALR